MGPFILFCPSFILFHCVLWLPSYRSVLQPTDYVGYFAVYDGHGGARCADFMELNLHRYLFNQKNLFRSLPSL